MYKSPRAWDLPWALTCLSCRVDKGMRRHNEEGSTLLQPAITSRSVESVKPETSAGLTPLKSSQDAEKKRIRSHACNGKQQVNNLEDRIPTAAPWWFPSHSEVAPHKPGHLQQRGAEMPPGDLGTAWLRQAAVVLKAALLALCCHMAEGLELAPSFPSRLLGMEHRKTPSQGTPLPLPCSTRSASIWQGHIWPRC